MELSDLFLDHGRIAEGEPLSVFDTVLANTVGVKECEHSEDSGVQLTFCDVDDIDGVISSVSRRLPDLPLQPLETSPCADWVQEQYEDKCTWDSLIRSKTCSAWTPNTPDSLPYSLPASPTSNFQALSCRITSSSPLSSQTTKTKAQSSKKQDLSSRLDLKMQAVLNSKKRIATSGFTADTNGESSFDGNLWQWKRQQRLLKNRESSSESRRKKKEVI
ncbi:uncharacterized protein LOC134191481 isoform X2 [Corticium candelabrum]|uniref:uncharacterized protein LOC134191481 isoform X2 n=1 Tax=Corticium candelabrum TaxID=121492 RepID=UPI002E258231|nr:uncharacterized protein LOC134191481 isoform X2 [Corticium candelabrum]